MATQPEPLVADDFDAGALTPSRRRERGGSGLTSRGLFAYLTRHYGHETVARTLADAGLSDREQELRDEGSWFSFETKIALWEAAEHVTGDAKIAEHVGRAALELNVANSLKRGMRALGSPGFVLRNIVRVNSRFNWAHSLEMVSVERQRARLRYVDVSGVGYHRYDCDYTIGLLSTVPQLFGLPPARVVHSHCGVLGDDECVFDISWQPGLQGVKRSALAATSVSAALAIAGVLAGPIELVGVAAAALAAGGTAVGVAKWRYMRRRMTSLQAQVFEQETAIEQLFEALGDLSSELRLEEVLEKVTAKARIAGGGHEFALLLSDGRTLHAQQHSGISDSSLRTLERWAESQRDALIRGPVMIDDMLADEALAPLATDPDMALGSMCAAGLIFRERFFGVLAALAHGTYVFLPQDTAALSAYAAQAAIAVSNARLVEDLQRQADEDPLTGLANTRAFQRAFADAFSGTARGDSEASIVTMDVDHFKSINDSFGHPYGDEVLRRVAAALRGVVRPGDTVARLGGEEFAVLLPGAGAEAAWAVAERARAAVGALTVESHPLSISAGIATHPDAAVSDLLRFADRALYRAKQSGRGRSIAWTPHEPPDEPPDEPPALSRTPRAATRLPARSGPGS